MGEWKDGSKDGEGKEIFTDTDPDGPDESSTYVGEFKDDEYHGQGTHIWLDGIKFVGEFKEGERWEGVEYYEDGDVLSTWSKGEEEGVEVTEIGKP